jgi:hypothetical protein
LRASKGAALALVFAIAVLAGSTASAHRRDEFLQAARLAIEPARVELQLDLTPGIEVADTVIADIDRDRDGALSPEEKRHYVAGVLSAVALDVDGKALHVVPIAATFPDVDSFRRGEGTIQLRAGTALPPLSNGAHHLSYRNTNRPDISVFLANALVPESDRVAVHAQQRDTDQRDLRIDYELRSESRVPTVGWMFFGGALFFAVGSVYARWRQRTSDRPAHARTA